MNDQGYQRVHSTKSYLWNGRMTKDINGYLVLKILTKSYLRGRTDEVEYQWYKCDGGIFAITIKIKSHNYKQQIKIVDVNPKG